MGIPLSTHLTLAPRDGGVNAMCAARSDNSNGLRHLEGKVITPCTCKIDSRVGSSFSPNGSPPAAKKLHLKRGTIAPDPACRRNRPALLANTKLPLLLLFRERARHARPHDHFRARPG